ncbi:MAG: arabinogalactan endo-1,4-beta-galactosidase [Chitinophagia bacterium]|nr:arabinogalactan endo-1,4-beta-galactosidase [Chitinophagia bacterium]
MFWATMIFFHSNDSTAQTEFAKGADISWLPQMEAAGYVFKDTMGKPKDCLAILRDLGMNTVRLRVFVDPNQDPINGHCSKAETIALALRARNMGFRVMIDFHYSDSWADPSKQNKPKAWDLHSFPQLLKDVYRHTYDVLSGLEEAGVSPEWVQIGNEIAGGFLWPDGATRNWTQLGQLLNQGYAATKKANPSTKVIVHVDEGNNIGKFNAFFDSVVKQQVKYDVIGLSYYPYWIRKDYTLTIEDLQANLIGLARKYGKEVMIVETGGEVNKIENTRNLLDATIRAVRNVPNHQGIGVLYWEPQGVQSWSRYGLCAWLENGQPSPALNAFKN